MSKCSVHVLLTVARYGLQSTNPMLSFASLANNFKQSWKSNDQIIKSGRGEHHKFINYANSFKIFTQLAKWCMATNLLAATREPIH